MTCEELQAFLDALYALDESYFAATNSPGLTGAQWDAFTQDYNERRHNLWKSSGRPNTSPRRRPRS